MNGYLVGSALLLRITLDGALSVMRALGPVSLLLCATITVVQIEKCVDILNHQFLRLNELFEHYSEQIRLHRAIERENKVSV